MKTRIDQSESESEKIQCWGTNSQTPVLRVELPDGSFYLFPYSLLVRAQFSPKERKDCLIVMFETHSIHITGTNLKKLGLALQQLSVEWVKEKAGNRVISQSENGGYVDKIQVTEEATAKSDQEN
jgi:hypothetical protein